MVDSVNSLVDSVISSMEEERALKQSKDDLITNVSHDLRTPLTSIIGYLRLIEGPLPVISSELILNMLYAYILKCHLHF